MARRKYIMTREQRQSALTALKAAQKYIWDGIGPFTNSCRFTCVALSKVEIDDGVNASDAAALVERSIDNHCTLESWVVTNNIMALDLSRGLNDKETAAMQAYRHRWVRHLITSLEESLKSRRTP